MNLFTNLSGLWRRVVVCCAVATLLGGCAAMEGVNVGVNVPIGGVVNVGANKRIGENQSSTPSQTKPPENDESADEE